MDKISIEKLRERLAELEQKLKQELEKRIEYLQNNVNKKRNRNIAEKNIKLMI